MGKKIIYCMKCGQELDDTNKCTGCGKQYFHIPKITIKPVHVLIAILLITIMWLNSLNKDKAARISELEVQLESSQDEITSTTHEYYSLENKYEELQGVCDNRFDEIMQLEDIVGELQGACDYWDEHGAIVTPYGDKYHTYECSYAHRSSQIHCYTVYEAILKGYEPCSLCHLIK